MAMMLRLTILIETSALECLCLCPVPWPPPELFIINTYIFLLFLLGLAMRMRNMRMMRIMRICGICGCVCGLKISSTLYTYEYLPKMATFWARNGSAWLCFQFWVPKISLLFIPLGFIHPQEWKLRVQNHKILVKKRWFFFTIDAVYAHWCASDAHRCASAKIGAWPSLVQTLNTSLFTNLILETCAPILFIGRRLFKATEMWKIWERKRGNRRVDFYECRNPNGIL